MNPIPCKSVITVVWNNLCKIGAIYTNKNIPLTDNIKGVPGNGNVILFWLDNWVGDEPLSIKFPALFKIERIKRYTIRGKHLMLVYILLLDS